MLVQHVKFLADFDEGLFERLTNCGLRVYLFYNSLPLTLNTPPQEKSLDEIFFLEPSA